MGSATARITGALRVFRPGRRSTNMSLEAWGDGDDGRDGYVTEERAEESFADGAAACREMMARFVEQGGDNVTAASIRANWDPRWGKDPGRLDGPIPGSTWES